MLGTRSVLSVSPAMKLRAVKADDCSEKFSAMPASRDWSCVCSLCLLTSVFDVSGNIKLTGTIPSSLSHLSASNFGGLCLSGTAAASSGCGSSSSLSRSSLAAAIAVPIGVVVLGVAVVTVFVLVQRRGHRRRRLCSSSASLADGSQDRSAAKGTPAFSSPKPRTEDVGSGPVRGRRLVQVSPVDRDAPGDSEEGEGQVRVMDAYRVDSRGATTGGQAVLATAPVDHGAAEDSSVFLL